ncbi:MULTISPECIES: acyl-CoA dehydrogenase family protein [unclassified Pseudonocardia]|uniref:acyl-CoA dehydrogenase family protein n=1 Tax=unclassified Pseudonocardia TaxID=2619320 RepID=UPI0001FFE69E|nr:acyl-CoA dehydrogenase family protein [Pseudonocardia sp. Ae707_Ps1]OLM08952.1 Butyryl-CoA dehydrogenase [Pseudonocardia sp. Ae707_Ps1]
MSVVPFPHQAKRKELRAAVSALCSKFDLEYWEACDREHRFPEEFFQAFADAGYLGVLVPEEYGGGGGEMLDQVAVLEELAASGGALNACSSVHIPMLCIPSLLAFGSREQCAEILPKVASGELFVTFGVTEPDAGTDTTRISTRATPTDDGWVINGTKVWNSGSLRGDKILLLARTSEPAEGERRGNGLTLFLTDLNRDTVDIREIPKIGRNAVATAEVFFHDHQVTPAEVVGEVGQGFYHLLHSLNGERLLISAEAIGLGRWSIEAATRYAEERVVFGRQIGKNQAVQHPLAASYLRLLAAAEVVYKAVDEYQEKGGGAVGTLANAAKYLSSEAGFGAADDAMQVFGGYSYAREYHIGRYWIESRLQRVAPINNQMVLNYIAERSLGLPRSY